MTTIVGDWRKKILVADSQYSDDDVGIKYHHDKVFEIDGEWFAGAGHQSDIEKVLHYLKNKLKRKPKLQNNNSFIWLRKNGLYNCDNSLDWEKTDTFIAIGSGAMAAEALLRHGLSAEEAVKGACDVDLYSSEPIKIYQLLDKDKTVIHT